MTKTPKNQFQSKAAKADKAEFQIFCDMDGVLTDFDKHAKANNKFNEKGQPKWEELDYAWWSTMPAYAGAKEFFGDLKKRGPTRFLSAPILNAGCFRGKAQWVKEFLRNRFGLLSLVIAKAEDKNLMARPNGILVDDRQKNIDEWVAAGGIGILHKGDYADTLKRIDAAMDEYRRTHAVTPPKPPVQEPDKVKIFIGPNGVLSDFQSHLETQGKLDADGKPEWTKLDLAWWKSLPAFTGAKAFYDDVKKLGVTRFLTGPVAHPNGFEGPAEWAMAFRPESKKFALLDVIVCRSKDKMLLARPNNVLIDFRQNVIDAWTAAGGIGILHKGDFADTLKRTQDAVAAYERTLTAAPAPAAPKP